MARPQKPMFFRKQDSVCIICISHISKTKKGYSMLSRKGTANYLHRFVYEQFFGKVPENYDVLHYCDNPRCCNIDHLWLGTHTDNMRDMIKKGRKVQPKRLRRKLSDEDVRAIRYMDGSGKNIGLIFGIHQTTVSQIKTGKRLQIVGV